MEKESKDKDKGGRPPTHAGYSIVAHPRDNDPAIARFTTKLWDSVKNRKAPELEGMVIVATQRFKELYALNKHEQSQAFLNLGLPIEFKDLKRRTYDSFRQDMKTLQALKIKFDATNKIPIDVDPLAELEQAEKDLKESEGRTRMKTKVKPKRKKHEHKKV